MSSSPRFVFDTNILISAALFANNIPGRAFRRALQDGVLLLSQPTFDEIDEVISRPKFDEYLTVRERVEFIEALVERSRFAKPIERIRACPDPDDDKFLELAVNENAACIVSGDQDLLVLHPFQGIPIVTATKFLER